MSQHPELAEEQAYIERAYDCLDRAKAQAERLRGLTEVGRGGTHQARYERDVIEETVRNRLAHLEIGDAALVFGRIDRTTGEAFHIGRLAVADERQEPVVVDWRAPVAEPFYRATGRAPMGLARRRHFAVRGRTLLGIEDEVFGRVGHARERSRGPGALLAALEQSRTGQLGDIVATIQAEQDEIIRSELGGVLVVQGGPGTGKTVVALHRAAYLLYTYRFPLEDQGVLVIGPNRVFLRYIHRVLPSLGETGVEQVVLADLVPGVRVHTAESLPVGRLKGEVRMAALLARAVRDRQRPLAATWSCRSASRRYGRRRNVTAHRRAPRLAAPINTTGRVASSSKRCSMPSRRAPATPSTRATVRERVRSTDEVRAALEWMWPVLTPAQLLHDLFGSAALLRLAARNSFDDDEVARLVRPRSATVEEVRWTDADIPLLDEAFALLGPKPARAGQEAEEIRTYGHIVIDEAQDLTPMALRMISRRSLNGSITMVGDLAQATGAIAPSSWDDILAHLPSRKPPRVRELTIGYRIPAQSMALAAASSRSPRPTSFRPVPYERATCPRSSAGLPAPSSPRRWRPQWRRCSPLSETDPSRS